MRHRVGVSNIVGYLVGFGLIALAILLGILAISMGASDINLNNLDCVWGGLNC